MIATWRVKSRRSEFEIVNERDNRGRFHWLGESNVTAEQLSGPVEHGDSGKLKDAKEFVTEALGDGEMDSKELQKEATAQGISNPTLKRAKKELGVVNRRVQNTDGKGGIERWRVGLPSPDLLADFQVNDDGTVTWGAEG